MNSDPVRIALVGAGAFGDFCLAAFSELPSVQIVAIADTDSTRAQKFARQYNATPYTSLDDLLNNPSVEIVALNTPPFLHAEQGLAVLNAGKHLFCEKPLALTVSEGQQLVDLANAEGLRLTIDYVMRRNPLWQSVVALRESEVFGKLLHMDLANHAAGLNLPSNHWFWDVKKSGGIWIEHGVHFFDAFAWVAGTQGMVLSSTSFANNGVTQRVECVAQYGDTAAHFYHGFTHSSANEQTTVTLTFEKAHVILHEWVPTSLDILTDIAPQNIENLLAGTIVIESRDDGRTMIRATLADKSSVYRSAIQEAMTELAMAVRNASHELSVNGQHGLASLQMAVEATTIQGLTSRLPLRHSTYQTR